MENTMKAKPVLGTICPPPPACVCKRGVKHFSSMNNNSQKWHGLSVCLPQDGLCLFIFQILYNKETTYEKS